VRAKLSPEIVTIKIGTILQGDGGVSSGATVLNLKPGMPGSDVILCYAPASSYHPFVVWTYNHHTGGCVWGEYFDNVNDAAEYFTTRNH
jgi:hypothetical protein